MSPQQVVSTSNGTVIDDKWEIIRSLIDESDGGQGNAGIFLIRTSKSKIQEACILKCLQQRDVEDGEASREIHTVQRLHHPNIARLVDYCLGDPNGEMEMDMYLEYGDKSTLADMIRDQIMSPAEADTGSPFSDMYLSYLHLRFTTAITGLDIRKTGAFCGI
ncbi:hypothetical protein K469DRAFT_694935 [Zopfia rhizophila CBS 207.26]|uniref:Protein kinase domain-containing protein n=1 Tax=Zopfia rhizophila CBS 207.26 TaxID=1314779 RepID=A0A6A6DN13_9PEZI|nr:hypothetical protein K469DRAFT_694935 [Zopfia rhizophila CBS 207.26]